MLISEYVHICSLYIYIYSIAKKPDEPDMPDTAGEAKTRS